MRPHLHRPAASHRTLGSGDDGERSLAETSLGPEHPLVRSLSRSEIARQQLVTVTAARAAGLVWFVGGWSFGLSLLIGAAVAGGLFACRIALLRHGRREACLALIIQRGEGLPLPCVERLRRSLQKRKALERLASSIDDLVRAATHTGSRHALIQPLADRRMIRAVAADLREVASLLRGAPAVGASRSSNGCSPRLRHRCTDGSSSRCGESSDGRATS